MPPAPGRCTVAATVALTLACAAPALRAQSLQEREHLSRCWHLEHDYWELPRQMATTYVWWRRQALQRRWEQVREQRRVLCADGW